MLRRPPAVLSRRRDGRWELRLSTEERQLLGHLAEQLEGLVATGGPSDHATRRLFPPAYPDDAEREAAYELLAGEELRSSRRAALEIVQATATSETLTDDEVTAWMQSVNALRLVLGTRLDVSEDDDGSDDLPPQHPDAPAWTMYHYLSFLLERIIAAQSGRRR